MTLTAMLGRHKDGKDEKKEVNICLTHHERLDAKSGMVLVAARQIEGQDTRSSSPGCTGPRGPHASSSVIIGNLDLFRLTAGPHKADPNPVVDPDRELSGAAALERLEVIIWRTSQVTQSPSAVQHHQLTPRHLDRICGKAFGWITAKKDLLGIPAFAAPDRHPPPVAPNLS